MRHLGSIVLSLILAPVIYLLAGVGLVEALLLTSVSPRRWRRYAQPPAPYGLNYPPPPTPWQPPDATLPLYPPPVDPEAPTPRLGIQWPGRRRTNRPDDHMVSG